jgi:hypothetical protein
MLSEVNPLDARLSELEAIALVKLLEKRAYYVDQGRSREAHGLGTAIWILWRTLTHQSQQPTGFGGLS